MHPAAGQGGETASAPTRFAMGDRALRNRASSMGGATQGPLRVHRDTVAGVLSRTADCVQQPLTDVGSIRPSHPPHPSHPCGVPLRTLLKKTRAQTRTRACRADRAPMMIMMFIIIIINATHTGIPRAYGEAVALHRVRWIYLMLTELRSLDGRSEPRGCLFITAGSAG